MCLGGFKILHSLWCLFPLLYFFWFENMHGLRLCSWFSNICIASGSCFLPVPSFAVKFFISSGCAWGFPKKGIASGAFFSHFMFVGFNDCIASGIWSFRTICIASGASLLCVTLFYFKLCIVLGGALVYRYLVFDVSCLLFVPLWSWL